MASKSIIDRVLLLAAAVCAAGLVWQLSVLLTSKGKAPSGHGVQMASSVGALPGGMALAADHPQVKPDAKPDPMTATPDAPPARPDNPVVRVVYPGVDAPKTTAKITDPMPAAADPSPAAAAPVTAAPAPTPGIVPVALVTPIPKATAAGAPPAATDPATDTPHAAPASGQQTASAEPDGASSPPAEEKPAVEPAPAGGAALDINSASIESLNRLRGGGHIGQAIVKHRPYKSVDELVKRRVLRRDVFDRIRNQIAAQ